MFGVERDAGNEGRWGGLSLSSFLVLEDGAIAVAAGVGERAELPGVAGEKRTSSYRKER